MKKYLNTLLEDIALAGSGNTIKREMREDEVIPLEMEIYLEKDEETNEHTIGKATGLSKTQFPPETYWTEDEAKAINTAFRDMLTRFNLDVVMPENLPPYMEYRTLVSVLDKTAPILPFGTWYLEFCHYEPEDCPFGDEYCTCKENHARWSAEANPKNIPFIHNYCDSWCERCPFTNRCAVYELTKELDLEEQDISNKAFWDKFSDNMTQSLRDLKEALEDFDIEYEEPTAEEMAEYREEQDKIREKVYATKLCRWSKTYSAKAMIWYKQNEKILEENIADTEGVGESLKEYRDIFLWYTHFIQVKYVRALSGKFDDDYQYEVRSMGFQTDSNGTAKIALIGVERSFEALSQIMQILPQLKDSIFPLIALLHRIISESKREFPDSDKFIRPGFDEKP
jgi:hypothetical protein